MNHRLTILLLAILSISSAVFGAEEPAVVDIRAGAVEYGFGAADFDAEGNARVVYGDRVLRAEKVQGNSESGEISALGGVSLQSPIGDLSSEKLKYNFFTQEFNASGNFRTVYKGEGGDEIVLTAERAQGNPVTGDVDAFGNVKFESQGRSLTGNRFTYNYKTDIGLARDARAEVSGIYFRGDELKSEPAKYTVTGSRFTTCDKDEHPHYYLSAKQVIVEPGKEMVARRVGLVVGGLKIFSIPKYRVDLSKDPPESRQKLPAISMDSTYGIAAGYTFDLSHGLTTEGGLEIRYSTKEALQAGLVYDKLLGRPFFLRAGYRMPYYNGARRDLLLSRLPEVGFRYYLGDDARGLEGSREELDVLSGLSSTISSARNPGRLNVAAEVGYGRFKEEPENLSASRLDARLVAWLSPIRIDSKTAFSPGISIRSSHYGNGDDYTVTGFRLTLGRRLGANTSAELTYATRGFSGQTPLEFDKVELTNELMGKLRFPAMGFNLEIGSRYSLNDQRIYDVEYAVSKRFHCLEPRISWRDRFQQFSVGMKLVGL